MSRVNIYKDLDIFKIPYEICFERLRFHIYCLNVMEPKAVRNIIYFRDEKQNRVPQIHKLNFGS